MNASNLKWVHVTTIVFLLLANSALGVDWQHEENWDYEIEKGFAQENCDGESDVKNVLILIDTTTPLRGGQTQYLLDNYIKAFQWENKGDRFSIVALGAEDSTQLPVESLCAPKPYSKRNWFMDSEDELRNQNEVFRWLVKKSFDEIIKKANPEPAQKSLIMEGVTEIFRNKRYGFADARNRKLVLISDLYQNSKVLNFYDLCKAKRDVLDVYGKAQRNCPDYPTSVTAKNKSYMVAARPRLKPSDQFEVYWMNNDGRLDDTAESFWKGYFEAAGLPKENLKITRELEHYEN